MFSPRRPCRSIRAYLADRLSLAVRRRRVALLIVATSVPCLDLASRFAEPLDAGRVVKRSFAQTPSELNARTDAPTLSSRSYYDGAETLGRVGHEAILRRDILHQLKKFAHMQYLEEIEKIPEDVREEHREEYKNGILSQYLNNEEIFTQILDNHIRKLLFYNDYVVSRPKDQIEEQTKQLETEFNAKMLPELKETFGCKTQKEL